VVLQTNLLPDLPSIFGDKIQLQQVVLNLLNNAIEAVSELDEDPRELSVTSHKVNEVHGEAGKEVIEGNSLTGPESAFVLIAVRDSGPGLSATAGRRVFEPSIQLNLKGWEWAWRLAVRLSKLIMEICGRRPTRREERSFSYSADPVRTVNGARLAQSMARVT